MLLVCALTVTEFLASQCTGVTGKIVDCVAMRERTDELAVPNHSADAFVARPL
ncbi:MAG: hypothetical protein M3P30_09090 [Chloroflexota bacterium]|nr:hypothetical protein [Chloroflexota bacterium]